MYAGFFATPKLYHAGWLWLEAKAIFGVFKLLGYLFLYST